MVIQQIGSIMPLMRMLVCGGGSSVFPDGQSGRGTFKKRQDAACHQRQQHPLCTDSRMQEPEWRTFYSRRSPPNFRHTIVTLQALSLFTLYQPDYVMDIT